MKVKVGTIEKMIGYLRNDLKVSAIRLVRGEAKVGIKDAKDFVDMFSLPHTERGLGSMDYLDRDAVVDISAPNDAPYLLIDEELIFDPDLAAECPVDAEFFTKTERAKIVEDVLQCIRDRLQSLATDAIKLILYERFTDLPSGVRELTRDMMRDKFFQ